MRSRFSQMKLASATAVASALILSACQPTGQSIQIQYANGGRKTELVEATARTRAPQTPELKAMLTDVTTGDIYTKGAGPILAELTKASKIPFEVFIKMKPWYVGNIDLSRLPVKALSGHKAPSTTTVTSRQSLYEVWVNLDAFNQLTDGQKAGMLLQEYLTSIYLLKNISSKEICALAMKADSAIADCREEAARQDEEVLEEWESTQGNLVAPSSTASQKNKAAKNAIEAWKKNRKPKPYTGKTPILNVVDYENIEIVARYLLSEKPTVEGLKEVMLEHSFPMRALNLKLK